MEYLSKNLINEIKKHTYNEDSFYILDLPKLEKDFNFFKNAFSEIKTEIAYSYKTNNLPPLIDYLAKSGCLSEVVSPFEVEIALRLCIPAAKIIYNGPLKDKNSINKVLLGNGLINADSIEDLKLITKQFSEIKSTKNPNIGVRLSFDNQKLISRFGIEYNKKNFSEIINILNSVGLEFPSCIHIHYPQRDLNSYKYRLNILRNFIEEYKDLISKSLCKIDIGGAFPSKMPKVLKNNFKYDIGEILEYSNELKKINNSISIPQLRWIVEPGTALVANCLHAVGHISTFNQKSSNIILNTDLSKTLVGGLKNSINYPITFINTEDKGNEITITKKLLIGSFTCVEEDYFNYKVPNPVQVYKNSKIVISSIGSYSNVFKSNFIRGDIALFIWDGCSLKISRRRENVSDFFCKYENL